MQNVLLFVVFGISGGRVSSASSAAFRHFVPEG
jgi:hypothetical protein